MLTFSVNTNSYDEIKKIAELVTRIEGSNYRTREWIGDAFIKIVEGRVDIENINPTNYALVCEQVSRLKRAQVPETPIITIDELKTGYRGVTEVVARYVEESFDDLVEEIDEDYFVKAFLNERERIYRAEGKDIWRLLELSKLGDVKAQKDIRELISLFDIGEILEYVIRRPECYKRLGGILC